MKKTYQESEQHFHIRMAFYNKANNPAVKRILLNGKTDGFKMQNGTVEYRKHVMEITV